ncbi:MAG: SurA N-terminal domain-containing protein [Cellvibrionaceae bacterium]
MLQSLRDNLKGAVAVFIIALMVVPLMLFGLDSLFVNNGSSQEVASVGGEEITELELSRAISFRKSQLQSQFGDGLPADFISDENLRAPVLDSLVKRKVLAQAAVDGGMTMSDQRINELVISAPDFQVDGKFNQERFRLMVNGMGYTATGYLAQIKEDMVLNQQVAGLSSSGFITDEELALTTSISQQARDFYYLTVPAAPIEATVEVSNENAVAYYEENKANYMKPEEVTIEYLELQVSELEDSIDVSEEELKAQYEQEVKAFSASIERKASHILIEPKEDGSDQQIIKEIQAKISAGEDFAVLATEYSDDFGSKENGGDLGYTNGDAFPQEFEDALSGLSVGAVSAPVETDAGFHLIKLVEERGAEPPSFEDDKARIETAIKRGQAEDLFVELKQQFEDVTYNASNFTEAGKELGLAAKKIGPFTRSGGFGVASNPRIVDAAFSDLVLVEGNNSDAIEISPDHLLVLRVTDHQLPRELTFDEVKNDVVRLLRSEAASNKVKEIGEALKAEIASGKSVEDVAKANEYEWQVSLNTSRTDAKISRDILSHVFTMRRPSGSSVTDGVQLNNGNYAVINLTNVKDGDISALTKAEKDNLRQRLAGIAGQSSYSAYELVLEEDADVKL